LTQISGAAIKNVYSLRKSLKNACAGTIKGEANDAGQGKGGNDSNDRIDRQQESASEMTRLPRGKGGVLRGLKESRSGVLAKRSVCKQSLGQIDRNKVLGKDIEAQSLV